MLKMHDWGPEEPQGVYAGRIPTRGREPVAMIKFWYGCVARVPGTQTIHKV